jgi:hypothetical protein
MSRTATQRQPRVEIIPPERATNRNLRPYRKGDGRENNGRPAGTPNKITRLIKEATLLAAEQSGQPVPIIKKIKGKQEIVGWRWPSGDEMGRDGLVGYLRHVAQTDTKSFCQLLAKILPSQITKGNEDAPDDYETVEDISRSLKDKGISVGLVDSLTRSMFAQKLQTAAKRIEDKGARK